VLSANNEGEGGILVLLTLLLKKTNQTQKIFLIMAMLGAGLMLGDGMLTPAISVVSSIEGVGVASPIFSQWVIPISCGILLILFFFQYIGTAKIGFAFGPVILLWFVVIGALGVLQIIKNPVVLHALNPYFAFHFLYENGWQGYAVIGGVFLVVTGGEALYADLGHFGKDAIQISWFFIALPGLVLNYFGQAAFLLSHPAGISNPFYLIAPQWFLMPLIIIATVATIIASQAVISGTFSLTKQAILLGLYPRLTIIQTSELKKGQIYIPQINWVLAIGTLLFVVTLKTSYALAHAYGIAVNLVMLLTTILVTVAAYRIWEWNKILLFSLFSIFLSIDLFFLGSNLEKVMSSGWIPVIIAMVCALIMYTWNKGMEYLRDHYYERQEDFSTILQQMKKTNVPISPDFSAVFITDVYDKSDGGFIEFIKLSHMFPKNILIVTYTVDNVPYVGSTNRYELMCIDKNICKLTIHYGFMDYISIPQALYVANDRGVFPFHIQVDQATYLVETPIVVASRKQKSTLFFWQERLFAFLMRNYSATVNIEFYQLPHNRTISIGTYCVI
ncbi:MAG: potassium transporter Kup, partial [Gammaproteobacteria bacterium RIFCSPHIGHO2_02_FULL_39_13]